ncbi:integrase core domain-containing protein [Nocardia nova]
MVPRVAITHWKDEYNHRRRHSVLGYLAPAGHVATCIHRWSALTRGRPNHLVSSRRP